MAENITPIRQQYLRIKRKYPQAIVLFRLGDFYETFDDDARLMARELEITLTSREMGKGQRVPMAGIPYHALDNYLARLIHHGHKVAICEQVTRPGAMRGLVQREVVRLVTPGTVVEPSLLDGKANNYLAALVLDGDEAGLAYVDITTGEFATTQLSREKAVLELGRLKPPEVIVPQNTELPGLEIETPVTRLDDDWFEKDRAEQTLLDQFGVATLEGYGCAGLPLAVRAAGGAARYLQETQKGALGQLTHLATYSTDAFMALDTQTIRNLEIFRNNRSGSADGTLLSVIDLTRTAMGGRMLKRWLGQPLTSLPELAQRQEAVRWFYDHTMVRAHVISRLSGVADMERLINRVKSGIVTPRELAALRHSLETLPEFRSALADNAIAWLGDELKPQAETVELISRAIVDEPPVNLDDGGVIKLGFAEELDRLREITRNSRQYLAGLEQRERERTGIKSLKVGYNRVFGYYLEISRANIAQAPVEYIRKQTLTNGERFCTPELKEYESQILNAQERITELEAEIFRRVVQQVGAVVEPVLGSANALAMVDVFAALAEAAVRYSYVPPELTAERVIDIKDGRHPVVERSLVEGSFVPNDTCLSNQDAQMVILTGPNMSGKSTYLRQVALIVLLAQIGSFVPATATTIGLVDRIFTRIGAGEDIAAGQSTFMVEMVETANILNHATPASLLILDEIGRGTSTYDGLSIARAVAEYIHNNPRLGTKTLFATHYHEMVELAAFLPRVRNFNVAVSEEKGEVIFLHKIVPGGADKSYGIHVAKLAGLPRPVVHRAGEVLAELERGGRAAAGKTSREPRPTPQLPLFPPDSPVLEELNNLDIDSLTPLEALNRLYQWQKMNREK